MKKRNYFFIVIFLLALVLINPFKIGAEEESQVETNIEEQKSDNINVKDMGNVGISFSLEEVKEEEQPDPFKQLREEDVSINDATQEQMGEANYSGYVNKEKESSKAGDYQIKVQNTSADKQTLYLDKAGNLTKDVKSNNAENEIEVLNNKIIKADKGIVQTIGGYSSVKLGYETLEDAYNKVNGTTFSGGAFDGQYLGTEEYNGEYFAHIKIAGYEGYMSIDDVQIIPSSIIQSQSHYENVNGDWVYFEAIDPLTGNGYKTYSVDTAPEWSEVGVKYYTYDDENYYEDNLLKEDSEPKTSYNYFQNLPLNSTANYTGSDYKKFLSYKKKTNSQYYNATNAFVEAQEKEQINSLLLFAMANHEGAYGTSNLSKTCNNFFGYGAYDSDPGNACVAYKYDDPRSGIIAQAKHLTQIWSDVDDWRFYGSSLGDKSHGMNVKYASDPGWGKAISSMMYDVDSYLKGNENKRYRIGFIYNSEPFYTSSSLNSKVKLSYYTGPGNQGSLKQKDYTMTRNKTNGNLTNPRILITEETGSALKVQLPTPINVSNSTTCKVSDAGPGSYPNYDGVVNFTIPKNTGSFACDYGNDYLAQQKWYPKKDANGYTTYKVINDVKATSPSKKTKVCEKLSNGNTKCVEEVTVGKVVLHRTTTVTTPSGVKVDYINEIYNSSGKRTYYHRVMKYDTGKMKYENETKYTSSGVKTTWEKDNFDSNGKLTDKLYERFYSNGKVKQSQSYKYKGNVTTDYINKIYNSSGKINYYHRVMRYDNGKIKYDSETKYTSSGVKVSTKKENFDSNGKRTSKSYEQFHSNGKVKQSQNYKYKGNVTTDYINEIYNTSGKRTYYHRVMKNDNNTMKYENETKYTSKGVKTTWEKDNFDSNGKLIDKLYERFHSNGKVKQSQDYKYKGNVTTDYINEIYNTSGKRTYYHRIMKYDNGKKEYENETKYTSSGRRTSRVRTWFNTDGSVKDIKKD